MVFKLPLKDLVGTVVQVEAFLHERQYGGGATTCLVPDTGREQGLELLAIPGDIVAGHEVLRYELPDLIRGQAQHRSAGTFRHSRPPVSAPCTCYRCMVSSHLHAQRAGKAILNDPPEARCGITSN